MPHTPGPWFIQDEKRKDFIPIGPRSRSEDHIVAGVVCLERYNQKSEIDMSDACLISAAPELLKALKDFVILYQQGQLVLEGDEDGNDPLVALAIKAIAKADGERQ
jgi:hypothetical protein